MRAGVLLVLAVTVLSAGAVAQEQRRQPNTVGPSALESHAARLEQDAAEDLKAAEYQAVGKYVVLVFSLFSDDRTELPLAKVTVAGVPLQCLEPIAREVAPQSASAKALGKFRSDTLCTVPVAVTRSGKDIKLDFARNHKDLQISDYPFEEPDFVKVDNDPRPLPTPDPRFLQQLIDREYPGFGFHVGQEASHLVYDKPPTGYGPVTLQMSEKTLGDLSADFLGKYPQGGDRIAQGDGVYPSDSREYAAFGNRGVMVVTAVTRRADELPLKRVYVRVKGREIDLIPLARARRGVSNPVIVRAFGEFREDTAYLVPASAMADPGAVFLCDFAKNRTGFVFSSSPYPPPDFIGEHPEERLGPAPNPELIKAFLKREYPGVFDGVKP